MPTSNGSLPEKALPRLPETWPRGRPKEQWGWRAGSPVPPSAPLPGRPPLATGSDPSNEQIALRRCRVPMHRLKAEHLIQIRSDGQRCDVEPAQRGLADGREEQIRFSVGWFRGGRGRVVKSGGSRLTCE